MENKEWVHYTIHNMVMLQRDMLREALKEAIDRDAFDELGNDAPWLDKARAALKATEE